MRKELKPIEYKGHTITVVRYSGRSARNGRETDVRWNAEVDGEHIIAYTVYSKAAAIINAKAVIDYAVAHDVREVPTWQRCRLEEM